MSKINITTFFIIIFFICTRNAYSEDSMDRKTIHLDGHSIFQVSGTKDMNASTRAKNIEKKLDSLLENPTSISEPLIESSTNKDEYIISISGIPIVNVTTNDAIDNFTNTSSLSKQWANIIDEYLDDAKDKRTTFIGSFISQVRANLIKSFSRINESSISIIPSIISFFIVIFIFYLIARLVKYLVHPILKIFIREATLENLVRQIIYYSIWILGLIIALDSLGIEMETAFTTFGITSLAFGLALKEIISNFVSGLLIMILRPFKIGDQIKVNNSEGTVQRIQLRETCIKTFDGKFILIPNSDLITSTITNNTFLSIRRCDIKFHIGYESDLQLVFKIIQETLKTVPNIEHNYGYQIIILSLEKEHLLLETRAWTKSDQTSYTEVSSNIMIFITKALKENNINLPAPRAKMTLDKI